MRIAVPHNTSRQDARAKVDQRIGQLLAQFGMEDLLQSVDVRIDEQLAVHFDGRVVARVMDVRLPVLVDAHERVLDAELLEKPLDQTGVMPLCTGADPYGHRLPSLPILSNRCMDLQTLGPFFREVK